MSPSHNKIIITPNSQYLKRIDPVTRLSLKVGEVVFVCEESSEVILVSSITTSNNRCPYCRGEIYEPYNNPRPEYPSELPWDHNALGLGETLLFSLFIGGGGGAFSLLLPDDGFFKYFIQIFCACIVMLISIMITKQPLGAALAVLWANLTPIFITGAKIDIGFIVYILVLVFIAWFIGVSIKNILV